MLFLFDVENANLTKISQKEKRKTLFNSHEGSFSFSENSIFVSVVWTFRIIFVSLCMTNYELKAMKSNPAIYVEGVGWRRERVASLLWRLKGHDYQGRCIYMITLCTEARQPLLGRLMRRTAAVASAYIEPMELGE